MTVARTTQQYIEAAVIVENCNAIVTQQYVEVACIAPDEGWDHTINGVAQPSSVNGVVVPSSINGVV